MFEIETKELSKELNNKNTLSNNSNEKIKKLEKDIFSLEDKLRQWKEKFEKLVNYLRNKVSDYLVIKIKMFIKR